MAVQALEQEPWFIDERAPMHGGWIKPDPITFILDEEFLNRPNIYPRQATLIKIIFLRDDLFTDYDLKVIAEWEDSYRKTGNNGICPQVLERIAWLKEREYEWFREVLFVLGRRGGKGYVTALCMAYILWTYMGFGDPQDAFGVDRDKKLTLMCFAAKRDQAKDNVWTDIANVILGSNCFGPYVSRALGESLSVRAPKDKKRIEDMKIKGVVTAADQASFTIVPKESTLTAGRGPASFAQVYDEMAHVVNSGANRSAEDVYAAATPSLDQFGKYAAIFEPSSPWQMMGQFYENYQHSIEIDPETDFPVYPEMLMLQLTSWDIYLDWEIAHEIPLFPEGTRGDRYEYFHRAEHSEDYRTGPIDPECDEQLRPYPRMRRLKAAIQTYDDQMKRLERANPETFKVERRSHFAAALDAYLNPEKVEQIFQPWMERPEQYGPQLLVPQTGGLLAIAYKGHGDPAKVNDKFGIAVAHAEHDAQGRAHCVFDLLHHFDPSDFEGGIIDYETVDEWIWENVITKFYPEEFTFDQYNSTSSIQRLQKKIRAVHLPKRVQVFEKTTTRPYDWMVKENSKAAINLGLVHAPPVSSGEAYDRAELELRFLQKMPGDKVDHPSAGPVQSKDIADAMTECIHVLIGEQVNNFVHSDMSLAPLALAQGGITPFKGAMDQAEQDVLQRMSGFQRARNQRETGGYGRPRRGRY